MSTCVCDARPSCVTLGPARPTRFRAACLVLAVAVLAFISGCTGVGRWFQQDFKVGPDYCRPPAPVAVDWIDYENPDVASISTDYGCWWSVFGDPVLDQLVDTASLQNLTLQTAGMRILEARARLNIARGSLFPQTQQASGDFTQFNISGTNANSGNLITQDFGIWSTGFNASWELDFWGRFRRAIESKDALLNAEIENYDNVLVILQAEVATTYIQFRTLQQRLELAKKNVELQRRTVQIADVQFRNGKVTELDVAQAKENMAATESSIPELESGIRQTGNAMCVLLGVPLRDLRAELGEGSIPEGPAQILAGIPAELLRRRPDVRRAERLAAAQSAAIGIAESEFYPHIAITGSIGYATENLSTLFNPQSVSSSIGPGFQWNILNYGRIRNNVRANEAKFHQLVLNYQNTVLAANQEVEDGIVSFLKERDRVVSLNESATQAQRSVDIGTTQYRGGRVSFQPVVYMQQILARRQDELATSRGSVAANLVSIYKALGGGWQTRMGVPGMPLDAVPTAGEDSVGNVAPLPSVGGAPPADLAPLEAPPVS
jgi:NodT family efflux transporter outer membrane factor (OMF) lipoprotein